MKMIPITITYEGQLPASGDTSCGCPTCPPRPRKPRAGLSRHHGYAGSRSTRAAAATTAVVLTGKFQFDCRQAARVVSPPTDPTVRVRVGSVYQALVAGRDVALLGVSPGVFSGVPWRRMRPAILRITRVKKRIGNLDGRIAPPHWDWPRSTFLFRAARRAATAPPPFRRTLRWRARARATAAASSPSRQRARDAHGLVRPGCRRAIDLPARSTRDVTQQLRRLPDRRAHAVRCHR